LACIIAPLSFAGREKYGEDISSRKLTELKAIFVDPKAYEGKLVTIEGTIINECGSGCWFIVKVGQSDLSIYVDIRPAGFAIPQYTGKRVLVEGIVFVDSSGPKIRGRGVEIK
ncbi:MAG: hypothetical protein NTY14_06310, partial [Candidatus Omnitrophica bacterium]|nr:hypothetical protein [Candidatus Omnitrophota bacterium]